MASLNRELLFLILQFLEDEKFPETVHKLEQESGVFFNMKHFGEMVIAGEWEELEKYLSGFMKIDDNRLSTKIYFEIRKQKYLEALDRQDRGKGIEILRDDLKVFATLNEELYKELTQLLTLDDIRYSVKLSRYGDAKGARNNLLIELKRLIEADPLFRDKLVFPTLRASRLRVLINQSLNWQHTLCKYPRSNPEIETLFTDHSCGGHAPAPAPVTLPVTTVARPPIYAPVGVHAPFAPRPIAPTANVLAGWMANATASVSSSVQSAVVATSSIPVQPNQVPVLKRPRNLPNSRDVVHIDYLSREGEYLGKRARSAAEQANEVTHPAALQQAPFVTDQLPKMVACTLYQGSDVTSIDFHPSHQTLVIVGSKNGEITLWDIGLREKLASKPFKIWDIASHSLPFQADIGKDSSISTSRVRWSPDGNFIGVAFTKHLIQLYATEGTNHLSQSVEIEAHFGGVNDLAFSYPNNQLCVVTCGDDKQIKVWDLTGRMLFTFEGHEAPVYSICPHHKDNIQFIFSTAIDGKIKAWLYDDLTKVNYDAPGHGRTTMLYSADGTRLFSCGTNKDGDSFLVEWNAREGEIKRIYHGLRKKSASVVQFDTTQNHFLAAGEDHHIKFWDMNNSNILTTTDAEGGLPSVPCLRFNKDGNFLAVSTAEKGFKILASTEGHRSLRAFEIRTFEGLRVPIEPSGTTVSGPAPALAVSNGPIVPRVERLERSSPSRPSPFLNGDDLTARRVEKEKALENVPDKAKVCKLAEVTDPIRCQVVTAPDSADPLSKVVQLLYTHTGGGILALDSNGKQKLWKWPRSEGNPSGKATASVAPQHWQPNSGHSMANDVSGVNLEEAASCIALSKNDAYVMSATGGKVTLFNMMTFKVMTIMPPPSASTFLAFNPLDNNVIAIGLKDSTILIYNIMVNELKSRLKGHQKHITGLAFSTKLKILVSAGADAQLCVWNTDTWDMRKSVTIHLPDGTESIGETRVQFNFDQTCLLVSNETQIAIYDASKMEFVRQWVHHDSLPAKISSAAYSYKSRLVYASFVDGNIGVFKANSLRLKCRIAPSAYLPQAVASSQDVVHPLVIAAHPKYAHQFALGMTDGSVKVLQPSDSDSRWGVVQPPVENAVSVHRGQDVAASSSTIDSPIPNQPQS